MAGSLIGKGGCHIKQIKDESGAFVQITPKENDLYERILIIEGNESCFSIQYRHLTCFFSIGDKEKRNKALRIILKEFSEDSHYEKIDITNLSYQQNTRDSYPSSSKASNNSNYNKNDSNSSSNGLLATPNTNTLCKIPSF
jgi:hypothetical protein